MCLVIFIILNMTRKSSSWNFRQLRNMYKKKFLSQFFRFSSKYTQIKCYQAAN